MKPIVIIPARGRSKGVPGKNIKKLQGKPLIEYTIEAARAVFEDHQIIVSTDDTTIKSFVEGLGLNVPFLRPAELATDEIGSHQVMLHALEYVISTGYEPDILILLQPTSPFRTGLHIQQALALYDNSSELVVSVKETRSNPYYVLFEENEQGYLFKSKNGNFVRRQDCPKVYEYNGAIYIINVKTLQKFPLAQFQKIKKYVMDEFSSHDIDTILDWKIGEYIIKDQK